MKRSEMVDEINEIFKELFPMEDYKDIADAILTLIENREMLPPETLNPKAKKEKVYQPEQIEWKNCAAIIDYYYSEVPYEFRVNEWEPEDE